MRHLAFFLTILLSVAVHAQDSCGRRVSLLTCAPGDELYSIFGHTAIRVQDAATGSDQVYNYGTFEFGEGAGFYIKFIRGRLPYYLDVQSFPEFMMQYQYERRAVREQEVLLDCARKDSLIAFLRVNALPQNREYKYDFLFDNCTTRSGDVIVHTAPGPVVQGNIIPGDPKKAPTFRNLIHEYLDRGRQPWSKLGIDLLLGARLDRKVTNSEAQFLPERLLLGLERTTAGGAPLMAPPQTILDLPPVEAGAPLSPLLAFGLLLALICVLSFVPRRGVRLAMRLFDYLLFLVTGIVGAVLLFMWFGTDHAVCRDNWNLFWALPTHLLATPFLQRGGRWLHGYLLVTIALLSITVLGWIFLPQQLNLGFLPIVLLLLLRAWLIILQPHHNAESEKS